MSLHIAPGEVVAILGESGVGKSTLLNLIAGLDQPDGGTVTVDGLELSGLGDDALTEFRRARIGFVFQAFHVLPYLSVARNVALPLALLGVGAGAADQRVRTMLAQVGLEARLHAMPGELSGGELQRVAIARALVHEPAVLLADEPTGNLDPENADAVIELLCERLHAQRATGVIVTHSRAAAARADRVLSLTRDGIAAVQL